MKKFYTPDNTDKRIPFAKAALEKDGFISVFKKENADFVLLGVNPARQFLDFEIPVFAGNISGKNIYDYTKDEYFSVKNAYLTAEGAVALAIQNSNQSLINSPVLITGYGRIGKALQRYLQAFTSDITICARNENSRALAEYSGAETMDFTSLIHCNKYQFIFNTVPHPMFNEQELSAVNKEALLIDLASFPGGVDTHIAKYNGINLLVAPGLPAKYSPKTAGIITAQTVKKLIKEVLI